jgi:hypothetical protein
VIDDPTSIAVPKIVGVVLIKRRSFATQVTVRLSPTMIQLGGNRVPLAARLLGRLVVYRVHSENTPTPVYVGGVAIITIALTDCDPVPVGVVVVPDGGVEVVTVAGRTHTVLIPVRTATGGSRVGEKQNYTHHHEEREAHH